MNYIIKVLLLPDDFHMTVLKLPCHFLIIAATPSGGKVGMVQFRPQVAKPQVVGIMNSQQVMRGNFNSPGVAKPQV